MKELKPSLQKNKTLRVASSQKMTAQQECLFNMAVDALLTELIRSLDGRNKGVAHGSTEE